MRSDPSFRTCWKILPEVSRSFAFVIRCLPRGLDDAVMTSYLLCRIADTIEDSRQATEEKRRMLSGFADALEAGRPELPAGGFPDAYRGLLDRTGDALACYRSFDPAVRRVIGGRVREMCSGMAQWCDREIVTIEDQNKYCYYVAGLVGHLLTDLFHAYGRVGPREKPLLDEHAVKFGLALQKVNIIRDVRADLEDGRCYWPLELLARQGLPREKLLHPENVARALRVMESLIEDLWAYLAAALRYLMLLPRTQLRLRMFCAIPLFMAVATAGMCRHNADVLLGGRAVKIPRMEVRKIIMKALSLGSFNNYLQSWFRRWKGRILGKPAPLSAAGSPSA